MNVPIPGSSYDVVVGSGVIAAAGDHLPELPAVERVFVVSDREVSERFFEALADACRASGWEPILFTVPAGEAAKSLPVYEALLHQLATQEAHRDDVIIALGGGAVSDVAGFVASTYMRGVAFVATPTTLLAQVDAAIGGKTAVNLPEGKNLVGTFFQPRAVLADIEALASLPEAEYRSGLAEVVKYGLVLEPSVLDTLERVPRSVLARDASVMQDVVVKCVAVKARVVAVDERESGSRLFLNYGHTLGHALERLDAFKGRTHGEAIAVGMVFAARLAARMGLADPDLVGRTVRLLSSMGLDTDGALPPADDIIAAFRMDKKFRAGVRFVLLKDVGCPVVVEDVPEAILRSTLEQMGVAS